MSLTFYLLEGVGECLPSKGLSRWSMWVIGCVLSSVMGPSCSDAPHQAVDHWHMYFSQQVSGRLHSLSLLLPAWIGGDSMPTRLLQARRQVNTAAQSHTQVHSDVFKFLFYLLTMSIRSGLQSCVWSWGMK